nr:uncharacterized mitochondrial protein AtMg00810-like [Tanacetum cinerariifolium]
MAKTSADSELFDNSLCPKNCLSLVEGRLVEFKNQEIKFCEKIRVLEFSVECKTNRIENLTNELELLMKEKEGLESKLTGFQSASKDLDSLLESQRLDKNKEGLGYSVVPPSCSSLFSSQKGFVLDRNPYVPKTEASPSTISSKPFIKFVKADYPLTVAKSDKKETVRKPSVKYAELYRKPTKRVDHGSSWGKNNNTHKSKIPRTVFYKTRRPPMRTNRPYMNAAQPKRTSFYKPAHSYTKRHFQRTSAVRSEFRGSRVATVNRKFPTFNRKFPIGNIKFSTADLGNKGTAVKASACWIWKPTQNLSNKGKFEAKGDEGYFIGYSMSSKAFRVFNKRTKRVEENLHVDFLENKPIEKGVGPNWLFNIDSLTNSMNYVPVVVAGTNSTNFTGTKEAAGQDVKKDVSSLRYIVLPNWFHETHLESSTSNAQDTCSADASKSSGNSNPTATSTNPPDDHMETLAVETLIPTVSSPVLTACLNDSPKPSSDTRLISKRVTSQDDTPSLDNILTLINRFEDILRVTTNINDTNGVEADLGNMETTITTSPTPTLRIHKDHAKSQIIGPLCKEFEALMHEKFQMSAMGELNFFLGLQVLPKEDGIFLSQDKYVGDILKKFGYSDVRLSNTPMDKVNPWGKDKTGKDVDLHLYRSMIRSLMYL